MNYRPDDPRAMDPDYQQDEAARLEIHREWAKEEKYFKRFEEETYGERE